MKNGGYAIISHDDINIFNKIDSAYKAGKPILFYDDDKTCFYVDSVKVNGDGDYEFTKGGKTWTVTDNNTLSSEGQIQNHLWEYTVVCSFEAGGDSQFIYFRLLSNELLTLSGDNAITNLKKLIGNKIIPVTSTVNSLENLETTEKTLINTIGVENNEIYLLAIDDENEPTISNFQIKYNRSTITQLF